MKNSSKLTTEKNTTKNITKVEKNESLENVNIENMKGLLDDVSENEPKNKKNGSNYSGLFIYTLENEDYKKIIENEKYKDKSKDFIESKTRYLMRTSLVSKCANINFILKQHEIKNTLTPEVIKENYKNFLDFAKKKYNYFDSLDIYKFRTTFKDNESKKAKDDKKVLDTFFNYFKEAKKNNII